jgi:hypothetical protein
MAAEDGTAQEYVPQKKNKEPTETEKRSIYAFTFQELGEDLSCSVLILLILVLRRKKIVPGSLMKAEIRPGGGDARPSDGDQVTFFPSCFNHASCLCVIV